MTDSIPLLSPSLTNTSPLFSLEINIRLIDDATEENTQLNICFHPIANPNGSIVRRVMWLTWIFYPLSLIQWTASKRVLPLGRPRSTAAADPFVSDRLSELAYTYIRTTVLNLAIVFEFKSVFPYWNALERHMGWFHSVEGASPRFSIS